MRPNVLVIVSHDTGTCVSPYGLRTVHTPACERLATDGIRFARSFCTAPQCSPARASLFTGRYPHSNGVLGLANRDDDWHLHPDECHLARLLGDAGYHTGRIGIAHETTRPTQQALLRCAIDLPEASSIHDAPAALDRVLATCPAGHPWYAQIGCFETHRDFLRGEVEPDTTLGVSIPPPTPDTPESLADYAAFQGAIRSLDRGIGAVLELLSARGALDDTIVVLTTDHGPAMPWAKGSCFDRGLATMCIMRYPAWGSGRICDHLVSGVDLLPTLLQACAIPVPPKPLHGVSLLPWLDGSDTATAARDHIWAEKTFHDCYDPMRCVREDRWKYIRYFEHSSLHRV
ncbi:MAG: sulfatase, partial [Planctomycetota bacterium]